MIKEYAKDAFKRRPSFGGLDAGEMQVYCIIQGLSQYLSSKGVETGFDVLGFVQDNSEPIDDSGLDKVV